MSAEKERFASRMIKTVTDLARIYNDLHDLARVYSVRGYVRGGTDPIVDPDVSGAGVSAAALAAAITLAEALSKFMTGQSPSGGDYERILSILRNDI